MTTITLPPDIEAPLVEEARRQGTTAEQLAIDSLRKLFIPEPSTEESLFDFLAGYIGTLSGSTEALSENCGQRFADGLLEKQQRGHL